MRDLFQVFREQDLLERIPSGKVLVAVSGGADSTALLHLMRRVAPEKRWELIVLHVQHNLRGKESLRDQEFVREFCKKLNVKFILRSIKIGKRKRMGLEETARVLRYRSLAQTARQTGARIAVTAHTANDQAETFLLNLLRGAGTDGFSGIHPARPLSEVTGNKNQGSLLLIRPLLSFGRNEILTYLKSQGLSFCQDSSNRLLKFKRNWVRHKLIPLMEAVQPSLVRQISEICSLHRQDQEWKNALLHRMRRTLLKNPKSKNSPGSLDLDRFFRYHISLRSQFLHSLYPRFSYREICRMCSILENEKNNGKREFVLNERGCHR